MLCVCGCELLTTHPLCVLGGQICDFGMARFNNMKQAKTGFMGTPAYMAPYVCCVDDTHCRQSLTSDHVVLWLCMHRETMKASRAHYSELVDVYSMGVLMAEMLTWRLAYSDHHFENVFAFRDAVTKKSLRPTIKTSDTPTRGLQGLGRLCGCVWVCAQERDRKESLTHVACACTHLRS